MAAGNAKIRTVMLPCPIIEPRLFRFMNKCNCMCSNCQLGTECHYSSYHCKHAKEYGELEGKGFCIVTGFIPANSWLLYGDVLKGIVDVEL